MTKLKSLHKQVLHGNLDAFSLWWAERCKQARKHYDTQTGNTTNLKRDEGLA